jgi:hypothetical protein
MQGKEIVRFSELVQDTIRAHGVKDAFEFYVKKHGLPPRQFQIFAGLTANKAKKEFQPPPKDVDRKEVVRTADTRGWWKKLRDKMPFEE